MDPISLTSIAISSMSLAANVLRPRVLRSLGSESDTSLQVLRTCLQPKIDIVCIPDLSEDPLKEWTKKDDTTSVNWLKDLLPLSLPDARILLFEYSPRNRTPEGFARRTIFAQSYELLDHLWLRRRGLAERRPLLFLVHNHGALIARSALIQSSAAFTDHDAHLRSIYVSTGAIFVLDAPKKEDSVLDAPKKEERLSKSWQDVLDKAMKKMPYPVIQSSNSMAQSTEWFEWQQDRYRAIASTIMTTTVVIKHSPRRRSDTGQRILAAAAAYKSMKFLGEHTRLEQLQRDGSDLMIFNGPDDKEYRTLLRCLKDSVELGIPAAKAKWNLDSLQRSLTSSKNEDWVKEAEKEYTMQLEQTASTQANWLAQAKADSRTKEHDPELQQNQRRSSLTSILSIMQDLNGSIKDAKQDEMLKQLDIEQKVMRRIEEVYGFLHARTLESLNSLAMRHIELDMLSTAESIMQRLLVSWNYTFGMRNKRVLNAIQQIVFIKMKQRHYADSSFYLSKAIDLRVGVLKEVKDAIAAKEKAKKSDKDLKHIADLKVQMKVEQDLIASCQIHLAISYDMQERYSEAEPIYTMVLRSRKDETDDCSLLCLENQALHWRKTGNLAEAARAYQTVLNAYDKKPPANRRQRRTVELKWAEVNEVISKKASGTSYF